MPFFSHPLVHKYVTQYQSSLARLTVTEPAKDHLKHNIVVQKSGFSYLQLTWYRVFTEQGSRFLILQFFPSTSARYWVLIYLAMKRASVILFSNFQ